MQVQGTIKLIGQTEQISQSFSKRDVVVTIDETSQYPQPILVQFTQKNCDLLNTYQVGQQVTIDINLRGKEYQDKQTGSLKYFNTIQGWRIAPLQAQQQPQQAQQQPQQQPNFNQAPQQQQYQQNNGGMQF